MSDPLLTKSDDFTNVETDVLDYWQRAFDAGLDRALVTGVLRAGLRLEHYKSLLPIPPTAEQLAVIGELEGEFTAQKQAVDAALATLDQDAQDGSPELGKGQGSGSAGSGAGGYT